MNWPLKNDGEAYKAGWQQVKNVGTAYNPSKSKWHKLKNTFLYVDEVMAEIASNATFMQVRLVITQC